MSWSLFFFLSLAVLAASIAAAVFFARGNTGKGISIAPSKILFFGVLTASVLMFVPIYKEKGGNDISTFLLSVHNMLRLFVVDGELSFVSDSIKSIPDWLHTPYFILASVLFITAPMITFGFVLSFFKNVSSARRYLLGYMKPMYLFSQLNERSMTLAESIKKNHPQSLIVFAGVHESENANGNELRERADAVGSVCFEKDIHAVRLDRHSKKAPVFIFEISDDESLNVDQAYELVKNYGNRNNTYLYVFSTEPKAEALLSKTKGSSMKLRRVNEVRSFVYNELNANGYRIFEGARGSGGIKDISAVIIGMEKYGFEMAKALPWFCQMDGYRFKLHAFSDSCDAGSRFASECPELVDEKHNNKFDDDGEAQYLICINDGIDYDSLAFSEAVSSVNDATYVLIDTGSDRQNIKLALKMRIMYERLHIHPVICAMVQSTEDKEMLQNVTDYSGNAYDIRFIGDVGSAYTEDVIMNSELEQEALARHMRWGEEDVFWTYEYNYKSSMASALHKRMKILCKLPGAELPPGERTEAQRWKYRKLEHRRWNAYMRSEGFVYSGSTEKSSRNNLGKMHNCLVPFDELSEQEKIKDDD